MDRKKFITHSAMSAFAMVTFGFVNEDKNGTFTGDCDTTSDILGPFYRTGSPVRTDLTYDGLAGTRIVLKGRVFKSDCVTPLKNAKVEVWHCDTNGEYDNDSAEYRQRASWMTNEKGEYAFKTILPGKYLNGALYRPSHIHYRVTEIQSRELVSQVYFKGDPHITKAPLGIARQSPAKDSANCSRRYKR